VDVCDSHTIGDVVAITYRSGNCEQQPHSIGHGEQQPNGIIDAVNDVQYEHDKHGQHELRVVTVSYSI
jgi:hypothetical protein